VPNRTRPHQVKAWLSDSELSKFIQLLKQSGMSQTDYIRKSILQKEIIVVEDLKPLMLEMKKQGINLNQIAHRLNENDCVDTTELSQLIEKLKIVYIDIDKLNTEINK